MPNDLQEALTAWQGGDISKERRDELLARLRVDAEFRSQFSEEIWMLSMTRTAQSPSPRWLELCEELGIHSSGEREAQRNLESSVQRELSQSPFHLVQSWWRSAAVGATAIAAGLILVMSFWRPAPNTLDTPNTPETTASLPEIIIEKGPLAVLIQTTAVWSSGHPSPEKGSNLKAGRLVLESGTCTLMFKSGAIFQAEGPADVELLSGESVRCLYGKIRTYTPDGAEGFVVELPNSRVTDLGTEMGLNIEPDGRAKVAVFQGLAEASMQLRNQDGFRTRTIAESEVIELVPGTGEIKSGNKGDFLRATNLRMPNIFMRGDYSKAVRESRPRHYWPLNRMEAGMLPDELGTGVSLRSNPGNRLTQDERKRSITNFDDRRDKKGLVTSIPITLDDSGWAIEFWFVSRTVTPTALCSFVSGNESKALGFTSDYNVSTPFLQKQRSVRFSILGAEASERGTGVNLYSRATFLPYQWHHVVIQQSNQEMELWVDAIPAGNAVADDMPKGIPGFLVFGGMPETNNPASRFSGALDGQMTEIAVYDRMLSPEEIRGHAAIGGKKGGKKQ